MTVTTEELADLLELSMSSVYAIMTNEEIPYQKIGRRAYFNQEDVDEFISRRNGEGKNVPSTTIYQSNVITYLLSMLDDFESKHQDESYRPLHIFNRIMERHFRTVKNAFQEGRSTSFNGSKINQVMVDLRLEAEKNPSEKETFLFIANELYDIFSEPMKIYSRILRYTQLIIDVVVQLTKTFSMPEFYLPKEGC